MLLNDLHLAARDLGFFVHQFAERYILRERAPGTEDSPLLYGGKKNGGLPQGFARKRSCMKPSPADIRAALYDRHLFTKFRRLDRGLFPARAGTDYQHIVIFHDYIMEAPNLYAVRPLSSIL